MWKIRLTNSHKVHIINNTRLHYDIVYCVQIQIHLRASKGFDRGFEDGEASRRHALIPQLNLNADENLAIAA